MDLIHYKTTSVNLNADTFVYPTALKASKTSKQNPNIWDWNKYLELIWLIH